MANYPEQLSVSNVGFSAIDCRRFKGGFALLLITMFAFVLGPVAAAAPVTLTGTYWRLAQLNGEAVAVAAGTSLPHIALHADTERVAGFGGCNRFFGRFSATDTSLSIQPLGGTRAACADTGALEQSFLRALSAIDAYLVSGRQLTLSGDGHPLLVFEAVVDRAPVGVTQ